MPSHTEIAASLTELDIEALKGTMGAWDPETCERLRQFKLGDGHGNDFHITDPGRAVLVSKIAKSLSPEALEQICLWDHACAPEMDPLEYDGDTLPKCARELYDAGCIEITRGCIDEVWPTDLGRAVVAKLEKLMSPAEIAASLSLDHRALLQRLSVLGARESGRFPELEDLGLTSSFPRATGVAMETVSCATDLGRAVAAELAVQP